MGQTDGEKGSLTRRREQMMKSHSMEALETPTPSVNGDANEPDAPNGRVTQRQGCEDTQENNQQNASQHFHKQEKHVKRRHR